MNGKMQIQKKRQKKNEWKNVKYNITELYFTLKVFEVDSCQPPKTPIKGPTL